MGKKKITQVSKKDEPILVEVVEADIPPDAELVLGELGGECTMISLYRRGLKDGHWAWIDKMASDEFRIADITEKYGGGNFQARFHRENGQYITTKDFRIEGAPIFPRTEVVGAAPSGGGDASVLAEVLRDVLGPIINELRNPARAGSVEAKNPIELAMKMAEMMTNSFTAAVAMLQKNQPDPASGLQVKDAFEVFDRGYDLGKSMTGGDDGMGGMIGPLAGEVVSYLKSAREGTAPPGTPPGAPAGVAVTAGAGGSGGPHNPSSSALAAPLPGPPPPALPGWAQVLAPRIPGLLGLAKAEKDVELYAEVIIDQLPEPAAYLLKEQLGRGEDFQREFYAAFPETLQFRIWFDSMLAALTNIFFGAEDDAGDEGVADDEGEPGGHDITPNSGG